MCGISGIVSRRKLSPELQTAVSHMNAAQIHRGPDGSGEFSSDHVVLASRRLSIIDREGGGQPLYNEDESLTLVINGEIYNYIELRDRLKARGHQFRTDTDGEVILHLYEENETAFIEELRGMFAFALWDEPHKRLVLARDRMGEKPLYLYQNKEQILFASELKGLLSSGLVPFELDPKAVNLYFYYQYVPEPLTPIKNVRKLDAAQMLIVDVENWRIEEKTYWQMEDAPPLQTKNPEELIREKLEEVSQLIVRSDVPIGVALSGGLDSSLVAALATQNQPDLHAFSIGYTGNPASDERDAAKELAQHLKIPFSEFELDTRTIVDFFPELNFWRDDPIADISGFGYYAVMKLAREYNVPVMLQGQGGDELFWGYPQLRAAANESRQKVALSKNFLTQTIRQTFDLYRPVSASRQHLLSWTKDIAGIRSGWRNVRCRREKIRRVSFYDLSPDYSAAELQIRDFYAAEFLEQIKAEDAGEIFNTSNDPATIEMMLTRLVCDTYLRENGIVQGDRLGMASSVEMRLPLIDYKFVETIIGLRKAQPDSQLPPKHWLKEAAKGILPEHILNRPKRGFEPPVREWHSALFSAYGESLLNGFLVQAQILSAKGAAYLAQGDFPIGEFSPLSFKALVLEQWCRQMQKICRT